MLRLQNEANACAHKTNFIPTKCYYLYDLLIPLHFHLQNNKFVCVWKCVCVFFRLFLFICLCIWPCLPHQTNIHMCVWSIHTTVVAHCENGNYIFWFKELPFLVIILMFVLYIFHFHLISRFDGWLWQTICLLRVRELASAWAYLFGCLFCPNECVSKWTKIRKCVKWTLPTKKENSKRWRRICKHKHKPIEILFEWHTGFGGAYFTSDTTKSVSFQTIAHYNFYGFYGWRI